MWSILKKNWGDRLKAHYEKVSQASSKEAPSELRLLTYEGWDLKMQEYSEIRHTSPQPHNAREQALYITRVIGACIPQAS